MEKEREKKCLTCGYQYPDTLEYFEKSDVFEGRLKSRCRSCKNLTVIENKAKIKNKEHRPWMNGHDEIYY